MFSVPQRVLPHGPEAARHSGPGTRRNEIVAFVEAAEEVVKELFNRFADSSGARRGRSQFQIVFHIVLHRRLAFELT